MRRKAICALALLPALASAQIPAQKEKCVVSGRVTNALTGEPIRKADVHLDYANRKPQMSGAQGYRGIADADGRFRFEAVEPGEYSLSADRPGFLYSSYGSKAPNQAGTHLVLIPGQQMTDLNVALFPQAVISGRVVDEDGDPVQAMVQVFMMTWRHGKQNLQMRRGSGADDLGEYRVSGLPPGKYYISAQSREDMGRNELPAIPGKADVRQVRTFFPDATNIENAAPIRVQIGQNLTSMDIRLRALPTYHIRGKIAGAPPQMNLQGLGVNVAPRDAGFNFFFDRAAITKQGTFDVGGIAPGSYNLNLFGESASLQVVGRTPVDVAGADVNDVVVNIVPAGTLQGRIQIEGAPQNGGDSSNLSSIQIELQPADRGIYSWGAAFAKPDGSFSIENLNPGTYNLRLFPMIDGTYIKSMQFGQQEMLGKEFDFTQGVSGELLITLAYGVAEVSGTVQMPQQEGGSDTSSNKPVTAASIVLMPEELRPDGSGIEYGNTTQTGTFSIKNVPPGRYRAYALEEMKRDQMDNPDLLKQLESKGIEVDLKENAKQQLQLTLIPAADIQRILAQLGIDAQ